MIDYGYVTEDSKKAYTIESGAKAYAQESVVITSDYLGMTINGPVEPGLVWPSWGPTTFRILDQFDDQLSPTRFIPGWPSIETSNGTYDWTFFDIAAAKYTAQGVTNVIWGFQGIPQWATVGNNYSFSCTITAANPAVVTAAGNNFFNGALVYFAGGTLPTGLTAGTDYFVINLSGGTFNLSATFGGNAIATSGSSGSSTVTMEMTPPSSASMLTNFITSVLTRSLSSGFPIKFVEGQNEPNGVPASAFTGWQGSIADFVSLQSVIWNAVQAFNTANGTGIKVLSPPPSDAGSFIGNRFIQLFFQQGGGAYCDIVSYHAYPNFVSGGGPSDPEQISGDVASIKSVMASAKISKPIWISEYDAGFGQSVSTNVTFMAVTSVMAAALGVARQYWYAYDNNGGFGQLWTSASGLNAAGIARRELTRWMVGATELAQIGVAGVVRTCNFTRPNRYRAQAVWTTDGSTPHYTVPKWVNQYRDLAGNLVKGVGTKVTIGRNPILLENSTGF